MSKLFMGACLALQFFSLSAFAGFDTDLANILNDKPLTEIEALLAKAPLDRPLLTSPVSGLILYKAYTRWTSAKPAEWDRFHRLTKRVLELGASAVQIVSFAKGDNPYGFDLNPAEIILFHWTQNERATKNSRSVAISKAARKSFDLMFDAGALDRQALILLPFSKTDLRRFNIVQWLIVRDAPTEIRDYFYARGFNPFNIDDYGWNTAMTAAADGNLDALREIIHHCGPRVAAKVFNSRCEVDFHQTVLHAALSGIVNGNAAEWVFEIIEFLVRNGADPRQHNKFHDLIQEVDFLRREEPEFEAEFAKLENFLVTHEKRLYENYLDCAETLAEPSPLWRVQNF